MFNINITSMLKLFASPTAEVVQPVAFPVPQTAEELIGMRIAYRRDSQTTLTGVVEGVKEYTGRSAAKGLYMLVKNSVTGLSVWVHESEFVSYVWEVR